MQFNVIYKLVVYRTTKKSFAKRGALLPVDDHFINSITFAAKSVINQIVNGWETTDSWFANHSRWLVGNNDVIINIDHNRLLPTFKTTIKINVRFYR